MAVEVPHLLSEADAAAQRGDWAAALAFVEQARRSDPHNPGLVSGEATCLLHLGRLEEAVLRFREAAELAPDSAEAANNLGVALALAGAPTEAEAAYRRALELDPDHRPAWKNLALLLLGQDRPEEGVPILAALVQSDPTDVEALVLLASCYEEAGDCRSAASLYRQALEHDPGNEAASAGWARTEPAAAPGRVARAEHLPGLRRLRQRLRQRDGRPGALTPRPAVAFFAPHTGARARLNPIARYLDRQGWVVRLRETAGEVDPGPASLVVVSDPPDLPELRTALIRWTQAGGTLVVDLTRPPDSLERDGTQVPMADLLQAAALVTVPCEALAARLAPQARRVEILPEAWDRNNPLWAQRLPGRNEVTLGWLAEESAPRDLAILAPVLERLFEAHPSLKLAVGGPPDSLLQFSGLPEAAVRYIPHAGPQDLPYTLAHFDVLLLPHAEDSREVFSDRLPLYAGARGIPWMGSPTPAYLEWGAGGLTAEDEQAWFQAIAHLVERPEERTRLAAEGRAEAERREAASVAIRWGEVLQAALAAR